MNIKTQVLRTVQCETCDSTVTSHEDEGAFIIQLIRAGWTTVTNGQGEFLNFCPYHKRQATKSASDDNLLHRLWTKAVGTPGYDKREWQELEKRLGIN